MHLKFMHLKEVAYWIWSQHVFGFHMRFFFVIVLHCCCVVFETGSSRAKAAVEPPDLPVSIFLVARITGVILGTRSRIF